MHSPLLLFVAGVATMQQWLGTAQPTGTPCTDDLDCSLNGACRSDGGCECVAGWEGEACQRLRLMPAQPFGAQPNCDINPATATAGAGEYAQSRWGGAAVRGDDGLYHLFFTELVQNCSLHNFQLASRVVHATAPEATGPFARRGVALGVEAHNPQVYRNPAAAGGGFLLFTMGTVGQPEECAVNCTGTGDGFPRTYPPGPPTCPCRAPRPPNKTVAARGGDTAGCAPTSVAHAATPFGPWTQYPDVVPGHSNPSAVLFANGSVLLAVRHDGTSIYDDCSIRIFTAPHFKGPYTQVNGCASTHEDPMIWRDVHGFHMLTHVRGHSPAVPGVHPTWFDDMGGLSSSRDGIHWHGPDPRAYNTTVAWLPGGPANTTLSARQRPFLLHDTNGTALALYNGVGVPGTSHWSYSCTFVTQVDSGRVLNGSVLGRRARPRASAIAAEGGIAARSWPTGPDPSHIGCNLDPGSPIPPFPPLPPPPLPPPAGVCKGKDRCPNVLFIVADDARPQLGSYGHAFMHTPHLDALAATGTLFTRAYVQYAVCSPSRNSFMTGRRPDTTKSYSFLTSFRQNGAGAGWTTLPQHFRQSGYLTLGTGKVFHEGAPPQQDYPRSWSFEEMPYGWGGVPMPAGPPGTNCTDGLTVCDNRTIECAHGVIGCPARYKVAGDELGMWCSLNETALDGRKLIDQAETHNALDRLRFAARMQASRRAKRESSRPFFLAVGYHRPHLPWAAPSAFFDLYPPADELPGPAHPLPPTGMPDVAWKPTHNTTPDVPFPPAQTKLLRRALYATMSYVDHQVGTVLAELTKLGLANDTIVTFIGDHGQHVGEHNLWAKMTNFELAVRIPFLVRVPWMLSSVGRRSSALVEAVDLFRTLTDLAGLVLPSSAADRAQPVQGKSITSALQGLQSQAQRTPRSGGGGGGDSSFSYAFSQYAKKLGPFDGRPHAWNVCLMCNETGKSAADYMGYSVRSDEWRYTEWHVYDTTTGVAMWTKGSVAAVELYDHRGDNGDNFDAFENRNLAASTNPAALAAVADLRPVLASHFGPQPKTSSACTSDMECSLNGRCVAGGCVCDPAWEGAACDRLAVLPTDRDEPAAAYGGDAQPLNVSSWGGNILEGDDGTWHLWVSEFAEGCGLCAWLNNSRVVHATATSPQGPFKRQGVSLGIFSHNVMPLRAPRSFRDGSRPYFLFHIGTGKGGPVRVPGGPPTDNRPNNCSARDADGSSTGTGATHDDGAQRYDAGDSDHSGYSGYGSAPKTARGGVSVSRPGNLAHRAKRPEGPWEPLPMMAQACNNPAPVFHPSNGTLFVLCNRRQGAVPW